MLVSPIKKVENVCSKENMNMNSLLNESLEHQLQKLTLRDQVTLISAHLHMHKQEVQKYEALLDEVLDSLRRRPKPSKALPPAKRMKMKGSLMNKLKAIGRERHNQAIEQAKKNVLACMRKMTEPVLVSALEDKVPHTHNTVSCALKMLQREGVVTGTPDLDSRGRTSTFWSLA